MKEKILVIEDDPDVLASLLELLELEGFQIIGANNGWLGLQLATQQTPDLIVLDINMPGLNGYEVLNALRQDIRTDKIPFIFLTGEEMDVKPLENPQLAANNYFSKPVTPEKLLYTIKLQLKKQ